MIFEKVAAILSEQFNVDVESITMSTNLKEDLGADSLDIVDFTMAVEEEFEFNELGDEDLEAFQTVKDIVNYVAARTDEPEDED